MLSALLMHVDKVIQQRFYENIWSHRVFILAFSCKICASQTACVRKQEEKEHGGLHQNTFFMGRGGRCGRYLNFIPRSWHAFAPISKAISVMVRLVCGKAKSFWIRFNNNFWGHSDLFAPTFAVLLKSLPRACKETSFRTRDTQCHVARDGYCKASKTRVATWKIPSSLGSQYFILW